ncbi:RNA polymerase sigma factor [Blastopirellula marina]|uniref:RNA polymerase sigma-E factor n=1 Tax=Blastopirellula marina DSM 3645 TaxID=314230 RepID=A3ZS05_9BACT|nr:RNA polymerase sigma factor [Blastopirellula marina]EAQ80927.1 RNA polymerase sigma-E factor [Blastopirellula marina DSM 3645]
MAKLGQGNKTRTCRKQQESLEDVFARLHGELLGALYHLLGNMEDARDALQDSFIKCWRHQDKLPEIENVRAWIFRIAINTGRDHRESAWRRKRQHLVAEEETVISPHASVESKAEHAEQIDRMRLAVMQLRDEEREVFLLRQNGDMTYDEIAVALDIPSGTVKTRMRMALEKLRTILAPSKADAPH